MRGRPSVWARTGRLEGRLGRGLPPAARAYATDLALAHDLDPAEVLAEAEALLARARADGAGTAKAVVAWIAREAGRDPAALLAEAEANVAAWRARR